MSKIFAFVTKEFKQTRRQPRQFVVFLLFPIVSMLVFGFAFNESFFESTDMPTIIVVEQETSSSYNERILELIDEIESSDTFNVVKVINGDYDIAENKVKNSKYMIGVHLKQEDERILISLIVDNSQQTVLTSVKKEIINILSDEIGFTSTLLNEDTVDKADVDKKQLYYVNVTEKIGNLPQISNDAGKNSPYKTSISISQGNLKYLVFNLSWIDDKTTIFGRYGLDIITIKVTTPDGTVYKESAKSNSKTGYGNIVIPIDTQNLPYLLPIKAEDVADAEEQIARSPYYSEKWVNEEFSVSISVQIGEIRPIKRLLDQGNKFLLLVGYVYYDYELIEPDEIEIKPLFKELSFIDYITPGIIAIIVAFMGVDLASTSIAEERVRGTLHRVLSSSIKTWEVIIGKVVPFVIFTFISGIIVLIIGVVLFNSTFIGRVSLLLLSIFVSAFMWVMFALAASSFGRSPLESHLICDSSIIPMLLLAGIFFPLSSMTGFMKNIAGILPMTYSFDALRDVMIKGSSIDSIATPLIAQIIYILIFGIIGVLIFRHKAKST